MERPPAPARTTILRPPTPTPPRASKTSTVRDPYAHCVCKKLSYSNFRMMHIDRERTAGDLLPAIERMFVLSAQKIRAIAETWRPEDGAPVFTAGGRYQSRGWTEWTQGFQFGSALLQFDATGDREFLDTGRSRTIERMAPHLTHLGVHDHGFNNVSTYGNLWRLAREGRIEATGWEM